jgi:hypothetical protein
MDGVNVTTNRFAGMADGLQNFPQPQANDAPRQANVAGNSPTFEIPGAASVSGPAQVDAMASLSAHYAELGRRLEESNRAYMARIDELQKTHAESLIRLEAQNKQNAAMHAERFQKVFANLNQEKLPKALRDRIDGMGADAFKDLKDLEPLLVDLLKVTDDPQIRYLLLQFRVNKAAGALELTTKIVEHGTSGIKTVLQTQT